MPDTPPQNDAGKLVLAHRGHYLFRDPDHFLPREHFQSGNHTVPRGALIACSDSSQVGRGVVVHLVPQPPRQAVAGITVEFDLPVVYSLSCKQKMCARGAGGGRGVHRN